MFHIQQPLVFVALSGESFAYLTHMPHKHRQACYSFDGEVFYELAIRDFGGSAVAHDLSFSIPIRNIDGQLQKRDNVITYNRERYVLDENIEFNPLKIVPLPIMRRPEYFCMASDGTFVYISVDNYGDWYESLKVYIGDGNVMRQVSIVDPVIDVVRYRRGATRIETSEQTFFSPSPHEMQNDPKVAPQWGDKKLVNLNPRDYIITETIDGRVTIAKE